ncbi:uncharacterized protein CANTADRAFT_40812, partial [Suhomyces tanzawaensis NRRL Y-17324]
SEEEAKKSRSSTGKRKYHQKSRSGCSNCKKRRVKCDENKPICNKCKHLNLNCGYLTEGGDQNPPLDLLKKDVETEQPKPKKRKSVKSPSSSTSSSESNPETATQQATPNVSPNLSDKEVKLAENGAPPSNPGILNAGNLNNINLSYLVNNLSGLGTDLSSLGNLASLSNLATLAQLPIDLSNLGSLIDSSITNNIAQMINGQVKPPNVAPVQLPQQEQQTQSQHEIPKPDPQYIPKVNISQPFAQRPSSQFPKPPDMSTNNMGQEGGTLPNISPNVNTLIPRNPSPMTNPMAAAMLSSNLNMLDLRLMFHYTSQVSNTITGAGISDTNIWNYDIPMLAFDYPFLMHSILAFSATHLSRTEKGLDQCVTCHRGEALRLLREAVLNINSDNTDALVASALILIMDSLANASFPSSTSPKSLPASAWIFHVKGAATILTAVWPLTEASRFYKFISVDLGDLGDIINQRVNLSKDQLTGANRYFTDLECHDADIADLFPVEIDSPYLITLAYLNKLHKERYKSDFILRIFAFPALLDKSFLSLLMTGDVKAMRIMRSYYKLLRSFTTELKDKVWFLEGVSQVLPVDVEEYAGGAGGMHMMLDFLGGGLSIVDNEIDEEIHKFDPSGLLANKLIDTDNLPSDITSNLEVMQGDGGFMNM